MFVPPRRCPRAKLVKERTRHVRSDGGYRYFGAAKNLPGVKELFEKEGPRVLRRSRYDMHRAIDADYYGFRDEDDGVLVREEADAERRIKRQVRSRSSGVLCAASWCKVWCEVWCAALRH